MGLSGRWRIRRQRSKVAATRNVVARRPQRIAERNNANGAGVLSNEEVAQFAAAVTFLSKAIRRGLDTEWVRSVYAGAGYVVTDCDGVFGEYQGIRKTARGYALISSDERYYEGINAECARFHDALNAYAASIVESHRGYGPDGLGPVAWMWRGSVGPGVESEPLPRWSHFHFYLREKPDVWMDGWNTDVPITHGFSMTFEQFVSAIIAHPKVTRDDATEWPQEEFSTRPE